MAKPHAATVRKYARAKDVLTSAEMKRKSVFEELVCTIAVGLSQPEEPEAHDWLYARSVAADIWRMDRETGDGLEFTSRVVGHTLHVRDKSAFEIATTRTGLQALHQRGIQQALSSHSLVSTLVRIRPDPSESADSNVVPLKTRSKR